LPYLTAIDSIRAIAVTAVVTYHFFPDLLPGGFLGVDTFFVISGFLITYQMRMHDFQPILLKEFYLRRVQRLLPVLAVVLITTTLASLLFLTPSQLDVYGDSLLSTLFFFANGFFYFNTGYFDPIVYTMPLLHTWSLSVEEQFYLFWPISVILLASLTKKVWYAIAAIFIAGLALSVYVTTVDASFAFYMMPTRIFQFALGASISGVFYSNSFCLGRKLSILSGLLGTVLLGFSFLFFRETHPMPGWRALVPSLGAFLIIVSAFNKEIGKSWIFEIGPIRRLGWLSYSIYLWHWPMAVFAYVYYGSELPSTRVRVFTIVSCILLSWLSFKYVEQPLRKRSNAMLSWSLIVVSYTWLSLWAFTNDAPERTEPSNDITCYSHPLFENRRHCWIPPTEEDGETTLIWGDSHAGHLIQIAGTAARSTGQGVLIYNACLPIPDGESIFVHNARNPKKATELCAASTQIALNAIRTDPLLNHVVLSGGWMYIGDVTGNGQFSRLGRRDLANVAIGNTIEKIMRSGARVSIFGSVPFGFKASECSEIERPKFSAETLNCENTSIDQVQEKQGRVEQHMSAIAEKHGVAFISLIDRMCVDSMCPRSVLGVPIYRDSNHLRVDLPEAVTHELMEMIQLDSLLARPTKSEL